MKKLESLGTLAGGIAHDFNNILAAILGNINLAILNGDLNEKVRRYLRGAEQASVRAKGLTTQLLTFAKGGAPVRESASLGEIVRESAEFVLHGSNVSCVYHIPDDLWLVDVDKAQISQVIQNLVINADQAMPGGGVVTISCENCRSESLPEGCGLDEGKFVRLCVEDHGTGISSQIIDKVFDPYFTTKEKGSGLGLSICHSVITRHGGHIQVTSVPEKGTRFVVFLPAVDRKDDQQVQEGEISSSLRRSARILVMDDEPMVRNVIENMLQMMGYEVLLATDGRQAVDMMRANREKGTPIDLVIMDLTVPGGMGGREAAALILEEDPEARIIVASGYSTDPVMAEYHLYGFVAAIAKPYNIQDLGRKIDQILAQEWGGDPA